MLATTYASRTRARSVNMRIALATTKKGAATLTKFYTKMKGYVDDMSTAGQPLNDEEFVSYLLTGLDEECYNPLVSSILARVEPITPSELLSQMLSYELRTNRQSGGTYHVRPIETRSSDKPLHLRNELVCSANAFIYFDHS
jgi:hypothetical protein